METQPAALTAARHSTETQDERLARMRADLADSSAASAAAARALHRSIEALAASPDADAVARLIATVAALDRVSRAVARTTTLEARLAGDLPPPARTKRAATKPPAGRTADPMGDVSRPTEAMELRERRHEVEHLIRYGLLTLPDQSTFGAILTRALQASRSVPDREMLATPQLDMVTRICRTIGVAPRWRQLAGWAFAEDLARMQEAAVAVA